MTMQEAEKLFIVFFFHPQNVLNFHIRNKPLSLLLHTPSQKVCTQMLIHNL